MGRYFGQRLSISRRLYRAAWEDRKTRKQYALAVATGIHTSTISSILHGSWRHRRNDPRIFKLAQALSVPLEQALSRRPLTFPLDPDDGDTEYDYVAWQEDADDTPPRQRYVRVTPPVDEQGHALVGFTAAMATLGCCRTTLIHLVAIGAIPCVTRAGTAYQHRFFATADLTRFLAERQQQLTKPKPHRPLPYVQRVDRAIALAQSWGYFEAERELLADQ